MPFKQYIYFIQNTHVLCVSDFFLLFFKFYIHQPTHSPDHVNLTFQKDYTIWMFARVCVCGWGEWNERIERRRTRGPTWGFPSQPVPGHVHAHIPLLQSKDMSKRTRYYGYGTDRDTTVLLSVNLAPEELHRAMITMNDRGGVCIEFCLRPCGLDCSHHNYV